jgi:hypothetical protein
MKAILIDPVKKEVSLVDHEGSLESLYKLLQCTTITSVVRFDDNDFMYADDESWLNVSPGDELAGFHMKGWSFAVLGRALIVGTDFAGNDHEIFNDNPKAWGKKIVWRNHEEMTWQGERMGML